MTARLFCGIFAAALAGFCSAATIPAGTQLNVRLTDKVASESTAAHTPVHAVVIVPVLFNNTVVLPTGVVISGTVERATAAATGRRAELAMVFTEARDGASKARLSAIVASLDNARESVDDKGVITGIDASQTFGARLDQGIAKLEGNDRFAALAGIIQGAKQALKINEVNPNIDYDPGAEMTLKLTAPLEWKGRTQGPETTLQPFPNEAALIDLVNRQPFRTVAANPPRPSDLTNIMFIATEAELSRAFEAAGWSMPASLSGESKLETARALIEDRGYKEGPMSVLLLDGRPPDMAWQKGNNTFSQRHHLRIFRRPGTYLGKPVWVCSSTHDIGIDYSDRDRTFIHLIDPEIDKERAKVVSDLLFTGRVKSIALIGRPAVPADATNATGDRLETDGRMAVLLF